MTKLSRIVFVLFTLGLFVGCSAPAGNPIDCAGDGQREPVPIDMARLYLEYNATDGDLGVHGGFESPGWSELCVFAPDGTQLLGVKPEGALGDLTLGGFFFESREPEMAEFGFEQMAAGFPEGEYRVQALSFDGKLLTGAATFTHDVPAPPVITAPAMAESEEAAGEATVAAAGLTVAWEDVTRSVAGEPVTITGYEVIITRVEHEDPHGFSRPVFDVHLPPELNSLSVPAEFFQPGTLYELELLALEVSGNQTISVGFFRTE